MCIWPICPIRFSSLYDQIISFLHLIEKSDFLFCNTKGNTAKLMTVFMRMLFPSKKESEGNLLHHIFYPLDMHTFTYVSR